MKKIQHLGLLLCITCFISFLFTGCQSDGMKKFTISYPNGTLWQEGYMEYDLYGNEKECGLWTFYYKNSRKLSTGEFRHGQKHGTWTYWRPDGKAMYQVTYMNGVPVTISESS